MNYTLHPLKDINPNLLPRIAEIHMGDAGLLSKLGYPFILRYFEIAVKDERTFGLYAQENETGEIRGFSLASLSLLHSRPNSQMTAYGLSNKSFKLFLRVRSPLFKWSFPASPFRDRWKMKR